jgi:hypothetical protein
MCPTMLVVKKAGAAEPQCLVVVVVMSGGNPTPKFLALSSKAPHERRIPRNAPTNVVACLPKVAVRGTCAHLAQGALPVIG